MRPLLTGCLLLFASQIFSEPYFAVREGYDCSQCHVNPTGGGMRNAFGNVYAQTVLPARQLDDVPLWSGELLGPIAVGGNARYSGRELDTDDSDSAFEFDTERVSLYLSVTPNQYITLYLDEQVAPGGAFTRESWLKLNFDKNWYLKAGKFVLPFGWRLEDDQAFIRRVSGINFSTADDGLELGYMAGKWSTQLAITNGTGGADESDDGKQGSLRSSYTAKKWQLGINANINDTELGDKTLYGIFAGFNTGPISWLAEWDRIDDEADPLLEKMDVALLEANILVSQGHNLKITTEAIVPDASDQSNQYRYSGVWEFFPIPYFQMRLGLRYYDSDNDVAAQNADEYFLQLHAFF